MTASDFSEETRLINAGRHAARRAARDLAVEAGASVITRPAHPGAQPVIRDAGPIPGLRAAREIELGAQHVARNYIRDAREAGHSWHQIGTAMRLQPGRQPGQEAETAAEAAFTYAAGRPRLCDGMAVRPVIFLDVRVLRPPSHRPGPVQRAGRRRARP